MGMEPSSSSSSGACQQCSHFHECLWSCSVLSTLLSCRQTQVEWGGGISYFRYTQLKQLGTHSIPLHLRSFGVFYSARQSWDLCSQLSGPMRTLPCISGISWSVGECSLNSPGLLVGRTEGLCAVLIRLALLNCAPAVEWLLHSLSTIN